ncbi:MAG: hypothetical protein Q4F74_06210 [Synergistaceae bacterium]|nr:hypothetical protein [Synergistaceae bacterium]
MKTTNIMSSAIVVMWTKFSHFASMKIGITGMMETKPGIWLVMKCRLSSVRCILMMKSITNMTQMTRVEIYRIMLSKLKFVGK